MAALLKPLYVYQILSDTEVGTILAENLTWDEVQTFNHNMWIVTREEVDYSKRIVSVYVVSKEMFSSLQDNRSNSLVDKMTILVDKTLQNFLNFFYI